MTVEASPGSGFYVNGHNHQVDGGCSSEFPDFHTSKLSMILGLIRRSVWDIAADADIALEGAMAWIERKQLKGQPIYRGEGVPGGDGSTVVIGPGFMGTKKFYEPLETCLNNCGLDAVVYEPPAIANVQSVPELCDDYMNFLSKYRGVHVLAHSLAAILNAYASEKYHDEYSLRVSHLTSLAFGIPYENGVNGFVGAGFVFTRLFARSDEFEVMEVLRRAQSNLRVQNGFEVSSYDPERDNVLPKTVIFGPPDRNKRIPGVSHSGLPFSPVVIEDVVRSHQIQVA